MTKTYTDDENGMNKKKKMSKTIKTKNPRMEQQ